VVQESELTKIESDIRGFVRASYPEMKVRAEYWTRDPSRIALFFIEKRFERLYRRQRYHYILQLIPADYYNSALSNAVWFELTADEDPEMLAEDPDEESISDITPEVLGVLKAKGFFVALDEAFFPASSSKQAEACSGDFRHATQILQVCGFKESDFSDVFHVLMREGAFCDCEILYNVAAESRLKAEHWRRRSHEVLGSDADTAQKQ
jgi:hypothetical protein